MSASMSEDPDGCADVIRQSDAEICWRGPLEMEELARVEMKTIKMVAATCANDGAAESLGESRLVVHALAMQSEVRNDELSGTNSGANAIGDVVVVRHVVNPAAREPSIENGRHDADIIGLLQRRIERHRNETGTRCSTDCRRNSFPSSYGEQ